MGLNLPAFAGDWQLLDLSLTLIGTGVHILLPADPLRWAIVLQPQVAALKVGPTSNLNGTGVFQGITISITGPTTLSYRDWGAIIGVDWYYAASAANPCTVYSIRQPRD